MRLVWLYGGRLRLKPPHGKAALLVTGAIRSSLNKANGLSQKYFSVVEPSVVSEK